MVRITLLSGVCLVLLGCSDPQGQALDAQAVAALFRDQTAVGLHERKGFAFRRYFSPDGSLYAWNTDRGERQGRWWVDENGRHCVKFHRAEAHCRDIYRGGDGQYRKYGWVWYGYRLLISYREFLPGRRL